MTTVLSRIAVAAGALVLTAPALVAAAPAEAGPEAARTCLPETYEPRIRSVRAIEVPWLTGLRTIDYRTRKVVYRATPESLEGAFRERVGSTARESMVAPGPLPVKKGSTIAWYVGRIVITGTFTFTWCAPGIVANTGYVSTAQGRFRSYGTREAGYVECHAAREIQNSVPKRALRFGCR